MIGSAENPWKVCAVNHIHFVIDLCELDTTEFRDGIRSCDLKHILSVGKYLSTVPIESHVMIAQFKNVCVVGGMLKRYQPDSREKLRRSDILRSRSLESGALNRNKKVLDDSGR